MAKIKKVIVGTSYLGIGSDGASVNIVNASNPSDIDGVDFSSEVNIPSTRSLQVLKSYVDSAIIPEGALTFDTTPAQGSNKPVTSGGIYAFVLAAIQQFFEDKFIVLTESEYEELEVKDPTVFYMIQESEYEPEQE